MTSHPDEVQVLAGLAPLSSAAYATAARSRRLQGEASRGSASLDLGGSLLRSSIYCYVLQLSANEIADLCYPLGHSVCDREPSAVAPSCPTRCLAESPESTPAR
jgi:hypothetical protein